MSMSVDSLKLVSERQHLVDVLMSGKQYADIILKGGNVVNVITREIYPQMWLFPEIHSVVGGCEVDRT